MIPYAYCLSTLQKFCLSQLPNTNINSISKITNEELQRVIDYFSNNNSNSFIKTEILPTLGYQNYVTENSDINEESLPIPEENSSLSADLKNYIKTLTGTFDNETANWDISYKNEARVVEEINDDNDSVLASDLNDLK
ncbi:hypothetical protein RclHR1_12940005 [Rhizophagus clarus]|uniref:Uncharacterized protein n=1 Tax=Rhizophagus clarus TaxID=94130 RepID=A0A2Z6R101_9GLOM|nr:hypothetical protein RclHR1_12940005 [Rhizophagus clarus]